MLGVGRRGEHGMMTCGMEAKHDLAAGRSFQAQPLRTDGHAAIRADFDRGAHTPDIRPPGTAGRGPQGRALFFPRLIPGSLRGLAQFPMDFVEVVMRPQGVDVPVGDFDFQNLFAGEVGGQASLPELVFAFDFAFGLGRGGVAQADVVELERPAQLRQRVGIVREKDTVVIDVELQWATVCQESGGEEVEVGEQEFALVELGAGEEAAAIIQHVEHGAGSFGMREPWMGRGVELPEFADLRALPTAHGRRNFFGWDGMGQSIFEGPAADLGAVELEGVQAQSFGSGEAVRTGRLAGQAFSQQVQDGLRPRGGMVAAGSAGRPKGRQFFGAREPISGGQRIEAAGREAELAGGFGGRQRALPECFEHMTDEGGCVTMDELLMFFKGTEDSRRSWPHHPSSRRASLRSPSSKMGGAAREIPVLLTPQLVLFCSPRDSQNVPNVQ